MVHHSWEEEAKGNSSPLERLWIALKRTWEDECTAMGTHRGGAKAELSSRLIATIGSVHLLAVMGRVMPRECVSCLWLMRGSQSTYDMDQAKVQRQTSRDGGLRWRKFRTTVNWFGSHGIMKLTNVTKFHEIGNR
jgi:hypothetical protein